MKFVNYLPVLFACAVLAPGCGSSSNAGSGSKTTGSKMSSKLSASKSNVTAQKPAETTKQTSTPKPVPNSKTAGATTVKPVDPSSGGSKTIETWSFNDIDLDGDGTTESGMAAADESNLAVWWTGNFPTEEGSASYNGYAWVVPEGAGFILDFSGAVFACTESATAGSGCITCDASGSCQEVGLDNVFE